MRRLMELAPPASALPRLGVDPLLGGFDATAFHRRHVVGIERLAVRGNEFEAVSADGGVPPGKMLRITVKGLRGGVRRSSADITIFPTDQPQQLLLRQEFHVNADVHGNAFADFQAPRTLGRYFVRADARTQAGFGGVLLGDEHGETTSFIVTEDAAPPPESEPETDISEAIIRGFKTAGKSLGALPGGAVAGAGESIFGKDFGKVAGIGLLLIVALVAVSVVKK